MQTPLKKAALFFYINLKKKKKKQQQQQQKKNTHTAHTDRLKPIKPFETRKSFTVQ